MDSLLVGTFLCIAEREKPKNQCSKIYWSLKSLGIIWWAYLCVCFELHFTEPRFSLHFSSKAIQINSEIALVETEINHLMARTGWKIPCTLIFPQKIFRLIKPLKGIAFITSQNKLRKRNKSYRDHILWQKNRASGGLLHAEFACSTWFNYCDYDSVWFK